MSIEFGSVVLIVVELLSALSLVVLVGLVIYHRSGKGKRSRRRGAGKRGPKEELALAIANEIIVGKFPPEATDLVSEESKCKNCEGKTDKPRWDLGKACRYLKEWKLSQALSKHELCAKCLNSLAKIATLRRELEDQQLQSDSKESGESRYWTSIRRSASVWWDERKDNIKRLGKGLFWVGILIGGTALFARFYPNLGLSELKLYLYVLIAMAAAIWLNKWLVKKEKK
ncbi:MAG: hypothetical protein BMS9Abin34_458 [Patescibacteria group bacterium]|nr:MAG: hypothetical protein BMS9Abin34_458 [Patescibacteria group bacterium]